MSDMTNDFLSQWHSGGNWRGFLNVSSMHVSIIKTSLDRSSWANDRALEALVGLGDGVQGVILKY